MMDINKCYVCDQHFTDESVDVVVIKTDKGVKNINQCATRRGLSWQAVLKQRFHVKCRETHINLKAVAKAEEARTEAANNNDSSGPTTRLSSPPAPRNARPIAGGFDYRTCCLLCTERLCQRVDAYSVSILSHRKNVVDDISFVESEVHFDEHLKEEIKGRLDAWACEVRGRVESVSSLRSEQAVYHRSCLQRFYNKRGRPGSLQVNEKNNTTAEQDAFAKVIQYLDDHL